MADLSALMTSNNAHYCTAPRILGPMRRVLVPKGSGRKLLDPGSNGASQVKAHATADGIECDGLALRWSDYDCWYCNPPYGDEIKRWTKRMAYEGRECGVPGIALLPARDDTQWCQRDIFRTADAWVHIEGRETFWLPIPIYRKDAAPPRKNKDGTDKKPYYLRRWFPLASENSLPEPFVLIGPGLAVGPELGKNGKPQSAPFPSLVAFWAHPDHAERDPRDEIEALRELVRTAAATMGEAGPDADTWLAEAEALLGSRRLMSDAPMNLEPFERLAMATDGRGIEHPINVRTFARYFGGLGTLTVARGSRRGVYQLGRSAL